MTKTRVAKAVFFKETLTDEYRARQFKIVENAKGLAGDLLDLGFEMGRTELLRANNLAYKDLEAAGVFFVIAELRIKYRQPAKYDEKLQLETICSSITASEIEHIYKLTRCCDGVALAEGSSVLACINAGGKARRIPEFMYPEPR